MRLEITSESPITNDNEIDLRILFNNEDNVNGTTVFGDVPIFSLFKALVLMFFAPFIVCCNCLILIALYRFKRLRTASNYFLVSLAASDLGIGLCLPVTFHMHLTENKQVTTLSLPSVACYIPFCISITLCSASILTMAAIAVDRFTSLAQPLQYNNMITRTSVHRYIIAFWIYACIVGFVPILYKMEKILDYADLPQCDFSSLLDGPMQLFLFCTVFGPCALTIISCYGYIYVVARYHAKAIYTVEISLRQHQQDCAHHRYGQTLAITVGMFVLLWLPFQICAVHDAIRGTFLARNWFHAYLTIPIVLNSALNPWIYAYKNTEMKVAVFRVVQDMLKCIGYNKSVRYSCPVNVIVASANADRVTASDFNNHVSSQLNLTNITPMKYTSVLMSSLHDTELGSASVNTTIIHRIETAACLAASDCKHLFDLNGRMQVTSC